MRIWAVSLLGVACVSMAQADPNIATPRGLDGFIGVERLPVPDDAFLAAGSITYGETCQNCHGGVKGVGAPKVTSTKAWEPRIAQGMDVLIDHALNGFIGPKYTQMPARGANPDLTDEQVASAVTFMVWLSGGADTAEAYINQRNEGD